MAAALAVFALAGLTLTSCKEERCETAYNFIYIVKNATDREIVVSPWYDDSEEGLLSVTLSPGNTRRVYNNVFSVACDRTPLEDGYEDDDLLPSLGGWGYNYGGYGGGYGDDEFSMTVGGEEVPEEIWMRENWTFESDHFPQYGNMIYTLTVTDELLARIMGVFPNSGR